MAKSKSETCRFESRFGGGFVTNAQFLAEGMIARQARKDNVELPMKFWKNEKYERSFLLQLRFANSLLKLYSVDTILFVLRNSAKNAYSLGARWLDPLLSVEQKKRDMQESLRAQEATKIPESQVIIEEKERPVFIQAPSELDKLRNL